MDILDTDTIHAYEVDKASLLGRERTLPQKVATASVSKDTDKDNKSTSNSEANGKKDNGKKDKKKDKKNNLEKDKKQEDNGVKQKDEKFNNLQRSIIQIQVVCRKSEISAYTKKVLTSMFGSPIILSVPNDKKN